MKVQQRATQDKIASFGQTPSQLLTMPHIKRMPLKDVLHMQTIFRNPKEIKPYHVPTPEHCNLPASAIKATSDSVVVVDMNVPAAHIAHHKWQPNTPDGNNAPFIFHHGKAGGALTRMFKGDSDYPQAQAFASLGIRSSSVTAITSDGEVITGMQVLTKGYDLCQWGRVVRFSVSLVQHKSYQLIQIKFGLVRYLVSLVFENPTKVFDFSYILV